MFFHQNSQTKFTSNTDLVTKNHVYQIALKFPLLMVDANETGNDCYS